MVQLALLSGSRERGLLVGGAPGTELAFSVQSLGEVLNLQEGMPLVWQEEQHQG